MTSKKQMEKLLIYSATASRTKTLIETSSNMNDAIGMYIDFKESKLDSGFDETYKIRAEKIASDLEKTLDTKYEKAKGVVL